jgi:cytochrome c oxidase subunit III
MSVAPAMVLEEHGEAGGRSVNWWGMIFFITSEALIFANIIAAYLYLEIRQGFWLLPNGEPLIVFSGPSLVPSVILLVNTAILWSSSYTARLFGRALARGDQRQLKLWLLVTAIMGAIFVTLQFGVEYPHLVSLGLTPQASIFGSAFFTLTGFHGLHVTIGVLFLLICWLRALRGDFAGKRVFAVEAVEMYWHFVDGVWVAVFGVVYGPAIISVIFGLH